jgi:hypothetical protein
VVEALHLAALIVAGLASILTFIAGAPGGAAWWLVVHLTMAAAAGLGGYVDPTAMTASWMQLGAFLVAILALHAEEKRDPEKFPFIPWLAVQAMMLVASGGLRCCGMATLSPQHMGLLHIAAFITAAIANMLDSRTATKAEKWANRCWTLVQALIATASGGGALIGTLLKRLLPQSS